MPEISAYHESGHALMAVLLGANVRSVTIDPDRDDGPDRHGDTEVEWPLDQFESKDLQQCFVKVALAGPAAEMIYTGDPLHPAQVPQWVSDWQIAWEAASHLIADEAKRLRYLEQTAVEIYQLLKRDDHWAALAALVDQLLAHDRVEQAEIEDVFFDLVELKKWVVFHGAMLGHHQKVLSTDRLNSHDPGKSDTISFRQSFPSSDL